MPGEIIFNPETAHVCSGQPTPDTLAAKTLWQCDECGLQWVVVKGAQDNEPYAAWRVLTPTNRDGSDN